ncbi:retinol dehydrogenase 11-like isoform X1 [Amblyomma americanum]
MADPTEELVAAAGTAQNDALLPLWAVLGILTGAVALTLLVKLYTVMTIGKCSSNVDMAGKTVIITGANTGIGKETARELARRNARVILACRNPAKAKEAAADIRATTGRDVALVQLDLCSLQSVREFAQQVVATEPRLDVLILNAGMMSPPTREETEDGFEATFQANHLGHFLLTHLLLDLLKKSQPSRIVVVGSCGQVAGRLDPDDLSFGRYWFPLLNYCTTKQCNMLFTVELSRKLRGTADSSLTGKLPEPTAPASPPSSSPVVLTEWPESAFEDANSETPGSADSSERQEVESWGALSLKNRHSSGRNVRKRSPCVTVNCCHPGFVRSEIANRSTDVQTWLFNLLLSFYGKTVKEGAETTIYLAVSEDVQSVSGKYFKDCAPTFAVPWATNPVAAKKLYEASIRMTQLKEVI